MFKGVLTYPFYQFYYSNVTNKKKKIFYRLLFLLIIFAVEDIIKKCLSYRPHCKSLDLLVCNK